MCVLKTFRKRNKESLFILFYHKHGFYSTFIIIKTPAKRSISKLRISQLESHIGPSREHAMPVGAAGRM
jgi:hypothetical protein